MRKINILLLIFLICLIGGSTYYIFFRDTKPKADYTYYNEVYDKLLKQQTFETFDDVEIIANKKSIALDTYTVYITIHNAKYDMNDLDLLFVDKIEQTDPLNLFYPSLGLIIDEDSNNKFNLTAGEDTTEFNRRGYNINFHTSNNIDTIMIYLAFTDNSNVRHEHFFEAPVVEIEEKENA